MRTRYLIGIGLGITAIAVFSVWFADFAYEPYMIYIYETKLNSPNLTEQNKQKIYDSQEYKETCLQLEKVIVSFLHKSDIQYEYNINYHHYTKLRCNGGEITSIDIWNDKEVAIKYYVEFREKLIQDGLSGQELESAFQRKRIETAITCPGIGCD